MPKFPKFPNIEVELLGQDGNVFGSIGKVAKALKKANLPDEAKEFTKKAFDAGSYDEVLQLVMELVNVG